MSKAMEQRPATQRSDRSRPSALPLLQYGPWALLGAGVVMVALALLVDRPEQVLVALIVMGTVCLVAAAVLPRLPGLAGGGAGPGPAPDRLDELQALLTAVGAGAEAALADQVGREQKLDAAVGAVARLLSEVTPLQGEPVATDPMRVVYRTALLRRVRSAKEGQVPAEAARTRAPLSRADQRP